MDNTAQGYYNMIFIPAQVINLCSQFVFKPMLNQYALLLQEKKRQSFQKLLLKQTLLVAVFTSVCCVGANLMGAPVLGFLYQKDLSAHVTPLVLVVLGGGIFALCQLFYYIFVLLRWQTLVSHIYILATLLSIPITYSFIQWRGVTGAATSFVVMHSIILILYVGLLWKKNKWGERDLCQRLQ